MNFLLLLAAAAASQTCDFCGDSACSVAIISSIHASGAFAISFVFNTSDVTFGLMSPWCFNAGVGNRRMVTCIPDCESHCVASSLTPTIKPMGAVLHIPFDFHFNRDTHVITMWSAAADFSCQRCEPFQPDASHGYFCTV